MCGLAGVLSFAGPLRTERLKPMLDVIAHRGPDDAGYLVWHTGRGTSRRTSFGQPFTDRRFQPVSPLLPVIDSPAGDERLRDIAWDLFLGHRRLSILDLSPRGHQPMSEATNAVWTVYNGEIYNFAELRRELEAAGYTFTTRTDTEVLLHAYDEWGPGCVTRFNGMFAFAIWDVRARRLVLARDRYGIKPLYYSHDGAELVFGSEIKSILAYRQGPPRIDLLALDEYLSFQNVFTDRTLFEGVRLLPPGTIQTIDVDTGAVSTTRYWDFDFSRESRAPDEELRDRLYELVLQAVERQCVSDVPIGSYLSGGIDSGSVTALAARRLGRIQSFTGGFDLSEAATHERSFDERVPAERMASLFQTEHYECVLHAGDLEAVMDRLVWHLEDLRVGQCYPNFYVARLAGKFVKVVLSGTGGDELFGGYPWRYAAAVGTSNDDYVGRYYRYWKRLVADPEKPALFRSAVADRLRGLDDAGAVPFKDHTLAVFQRVLGDVEARTVHEQVNHSLRFECKTFLHGLLVVEDKLSMASSLETRLPLLDNDLVDFACQVPVRLKVAGLDHLAPLDENEVRKKERYGVGKNILRATMERILPAEVCAAAKQGFSAPDESWFRGRAEGYVQRALLGPRSRLGELLDMGYVRDRILAPHVRGEINHRLLIWSLLSLESWMRQFEVVLP